MITTTLKLISASRDQARAVDILTLQAVDANIATIPGQIISIVAPKSLGFGDVQPGHIYRMAFLKPSEHVVEDELYGTSDPEEIVKNSDAHKFERDAVPPSMTAVAEEVAPIPEALARQSIFPPTLDEEQSAQRQAERNAETWAAMAEQQVTQAGKDWLSKHPLTTEGVLSFRQAQRDASAAAIAKEEARKAAAEKK